MTAQPSAPRDGPAQLDRTRVTVAPGALAEAVLARVVGISAARADLPVDRVDEALILAETIAAHASGHVAGGRIELTCRTTPGCLEMHLGPLRPGGGAQLIDERAMPGAAGIILRCASEARVVERAESELLVLRVVS